MVILGCILYDCVTKILFTIGDYNISEEHIVKSLDMDTSLSYFIPNMTDEGQCTLALVDYLVDVHNKCIYQCEATITNMRISGVTWYHMYCKLWLHYITTLCSQEISLERSCCAIGRSSKDRPYFV